MILAGFRADIPHLMRALDVLVLPSRAESFGLVLLEAMALEVPVVDHGAGEQCDDGNLVSGDGCSHFCQLELCGNGVLEPDFGETCDGTDLGGADCLALGFTGGTLGCDGGCMFDTSQCTNPSCGDGNVDAGSGC